jgi:hypothetical protein
MNIGKVVKIYRGIPVPVPAPVIEPVPEQEKVPVKSNAK